MANYILFETASGYALFERLQSEEIGSKLESVQASIADLSKFSKMLKLKSFAPFKNAADALENANDVSEGIVNPSLKAFLEMNLPKAGKKTKVCLGVGEKNLAGAIKAALSIDCASDELVQDMVRGIRKWAEKMLNLKTGDLQRAQLGLGHSYSRAKVKFNVNRADNMVIQAIGTLDQIDKDVNLFGMRLREWYSWHFPEMVKIVNDNYKYAKLVKLIGNKGELAEDKLEAMTAILDDDEAMAKQILSAARASMGADLSPVDMIQVHTFANRVEALAEYRKNLHAYLVNKMNHVAPNLAALIGEMVGARLISQAGSLTNLSKYPASTLQILGAEKALFRALKTKGNTPKYGLIYHSSFIGRAGQKNKGRISRYLANKCTIAARIDCFSDQPTDKFGQALREQVDERLKFFDSGALPQKNIDVMKKVIDTLDIDDEEVPAVAGKKRTADESNVDEDDKAAKKSKKDKKEKKEKKDKKEKKKEKKEKK
ncbi:hypothetical protein BD560DRAFT_393993 [Blakeslea trispora]|nr:hypothetical protein BD560DRAFT_393993 [Blakeslea trispora]